MPANLPPTRNRWLIPSIDVASFWEGFRAMGVPCIGIAVWGLVTGVALVSGDPTNKRGLTIPLAMVMTFLPFAGSAQLGALPLLAVGAPLPVIWVTGALINVRFMIYSAATRQLVLHLPLPQKILTTYLYGDVPGAVYLQRYPDTSNAGTPQQLGFMLGCSSINWVVWMTASVIGIFLGQAAPAEWGLELAATLALVAVVIPMMVRRPTVVGCLVTAIVSTLLTNLPMKTGLLVAVVAGVVCALTSEAVGSKIKAKQAVS